MLSSHLITLALFVLKATCKPLSAHTDRSDLTMSLDANLESHKITSRQSPSLPEPRLEPLRYINTTRLQVAYYEDGPADGKVILLLHGWPYDIHSYTDVAPALVKQGYRVIVPYLRGNGPTTFLHTDTFRSGQQAALGYDIIELLDALSIKKAIFAGYDWGGRGACVAAALWPERCAGLVSVNSYLIQDLSKAWVPLDAKIEAG